MIETIMKYTYIYNICWEDPRVDRQLLTIDPAHRLFVFSSAGCNVLDYLLESPAQIVACDKNPFQLYLLELKLAMLRDCDITYSEWWAVWGDSDPFVASAVWTRVRHTTSNPAREFWDSRIQSVFQTPYSYTGTSGFIVQRIIPLLLRAIGTSLHEARRMARQSHEVFSNCLEHSGVLRRFAAAVAASTRVPFLMNLLGVPRSQLEECPFLCSRDWWTSLFKQIYVDDQSFATNNYFYFFYLFGKFSKDCCPRILLPQYFDTLKRNAGRVKICQALVVDALDSFPDDYFTHFVLLDHQDWMTNVAIQNEWNLICRKATPNARVLWRSIHRRIENRYPFFATLRSVMSDVSMASYICDRVKTYPGTFIATIPKGFEVPSMTEELNNAVGPLSQAFCVASMLIHPFRERLVGKTSHKARMELFYSGQARAYDTVREKMLSARCALVSLPGPFNAAASPRTWVDIGGGTGRTIRYLSKHMHLFDLVVVVDICEALLEEGQRVTREQLQKHEFDKIMWVCADVTSVDFSRVIKCKTGRKTFDAVTFSYSLTMIPDWRRAVTQARALCRGKLMVADFDTFTDDGISWKDVLLAKWFSQDRVVISAERRKYLKRVLPKHYEKRWTEDGLVTGLGLLHYVFAADLKQNAA